MFGKLTTAVAATACLIATTIAGNAAAFAGGAHADPQVQLAQESSAKVVTDYTACVGTSLPTQPGTPSTALEVTNASGLSGTMRITFWRQACRDNPANSVILMAVDPVSGTPFFTDTALNATQDGVSYGLLIAARNPAFPFLVYGGFITGRVVAMVVQNPLASPRFNENGALCLSYITPAASASTCLAASGGSGGISPPDVTGMWYRSSESGWGLSLIQGSAPAKTPFVVLYVYAGGSPTWFVMPGATWSSATRFVGDLYATTGPDYREGSFDPGRVGVSPVGTLEMSFSGTTAATLRYTIRQSDGSTVTVNKSVERQAF